MAVTVRIFSWNMKNVGGPARDYDALTAFIIEAIILWRPNIVAIMEVRANKGSTLGAKIVAELDATLMGSAWAFQESGQTGVLREQYLFLWDTTVVDGAGFFPTPADVAAKTVYTNAAGNTLGFPKNGNASCAPAIRPYQSRPPFRGYFTEPGTGQSLPIYVFHAESFVGWAVDGCQKLAAITEANTDPRGLFMGDFNVSPSDVTGGGRAATAFTPLHGGLGYIQQIGGNDKTSVKDYASAGTVPAVAAPSPADIQACLASDYDNFFLKAGGFAVGNHAIGYLFEDCLPGKDLHDALAKCWQHKAALPAQPVIGDLRTAFQNYAHYISDHLPIILEVDFQ